ncbi:MAG: nicotinate-nucleotide adenylyltransferase [Deltaproteobacteria bacterium]|nr:nicotinate-nucleotide adenylyltransferase [Deltaproteobacteria bacterium]
MRIAIIGGTFNPIHYGHLRVAEEAREALSLDKVVFMPANIAPHKTESPAPPEARLDLVRLSIAGNPFFEVSDIEIKRGGRSFTIDTLRALKEKDKSLDISLIIGNDSWNDITTWCEYESIFELSSFIVVERPGYPVKKPGEVLPVELARKFWYDADKGMFVNSFGTTITYLSTTLMDIASSDLRAKVREGASVRYMLPDPVIEYIQKTGLYK